MPLSLTIPKRLIYPPSMDYTLLRREGLRHIERLGSAVWTDFNSHDPGVTMLEVLCYALTDLGYRTQLPAADLFTPSGNRKAFFTAAEILPNAPVTALDFRKILIDTEGVKNAWLQGCVDAPVLFQLLDLGKVVNIKFDASKYPTVLQLTTAEVSFSLNTVVLNLPDPNDTTTPSKIITTVEAYLKAVSILYKKGKTQDALKASNRLVDGIIEDYKKKLDDNKKKITILNYAHDAKALADLRTWINKHDLNKSTANVLSNLVVIPDLLIKGNFIEVQAKLNLVVALLNSEISLFNYLLVSPTWKQLFNPTDLAIKPLDHASAYSLFTPRGIYKIYLQLEDGCAQMADDIRAKALQRLHENRALSEDFDAPITIIDKAFIGIETTIELTPEADLTKVFADILYAVEEFLSPTVKMYSLQEMMDKYATFELTATSLEALVEAELPAEVIKNLEILRGVKFIGKTVLMDAIFKAIGATAMDDYEALIFNETEKTYESHPVFQGPLLNHGFIDDAELEMANWRRTVYKSDLFQVISKVEGVVRVQRLGIHKCPKDDENIRTIEKEWCLSFDCDCQPTLDLDCSTFSFTNGGRPVIPNNNLLFEVSDKLEQLRGQNAKIDRTNDRDLPIPKGKQRDDLAEYTSIQEEFPKTYHVGNEGIVSTETPLRKAQVKQMKGFLMFFDQILTNYLAHLSQIRDVLAIEESSEKLHLFQPLYDAPKVKDLFTAFNPETDNWEDFINNPDNNYIKALQSLTDGSDIAQKLRQNQLLDHLLARFGETFTDYVLDLFKIDRPIDEDAANTEGVNDWIADKRRFLKNLPEIGSLRGRGFNYRAEPQEDNHHFWESNNIEGFKRRVFAQLGIENWQRRTISCAPNFYVSTQLEVIRKTKRYRFGIKANEEAHSFWLLSTALFSQTDATEKAADEFFSLAADDKKYGVVAEEKLYYVGFWNENFKNQSKKGDALLLSEAFKDKKAADKLYREIKQNLEQQCQSENFHMVEHILLRPADEYYLPLKPMIVSEDLTRLDPYSFWITILVPDWVERFYDPKQFDYFEQMVRSEVPAHIAMRFAKLNRENMLSFEQNYFNWLKTKTDAETEPYDLRETTNKLVESLNSYHYE